MNRDTCRQSWHPGVGFADADFGGVMSWSAPESFNVTVRPTSDEGGQVFRIPRRMSSIPGRDSAAVAR